MIPQRWSRTAVGLVVGGIALALVTALLSAAVYSFSAASKANDLSQAFIEANNQLTDLRHDSAESEARAAGAQRERADLMEQNELLQQQVAALVRYLRTHGLPVPVVESPAPEVSTPSPLRPAPTRPKIPPPQDTPAPRPTCLAPRLLCVTFKPRRGPHHPRRGHGH